LDINIPTYMFFDLQSSFLIKVWTQCF